MKRMEQDYGREAEFRALTYGSEKGEEGRAVEFLDGGS